MDAARQLPQLLERARQLVAGRGDEQLGGGRVGVDPAPRQPQLQGERDEPLLRAVVQVALDPAALGVPGRHQALARGAQLREALLGLHVQPLVLDRDRRAGSDGLDHLRIVVERGVVDDRRHPAPVVVDVRDRPVGVRRRDRHRRAARVQVALGARLPVGEHEPGIPERARQRGPQRFAAHRSQLCEQLGQPAAREPRAQLAREEGGRNGEQREGRDPSQQRQVIGRDDLHHAERDQAGDPRHARQHRPPARRRRRAPARRDHDRHGHAQRRGQVALHILDRAAGVLPHAQPDRLQDRLGDRPREDERPVERRDEPALRERREQQRHERQRPQVLGQIRERQQPPGAQLDADRQDREPEAGQGHQRADVAVGSPVPCDQPAGRERRGHDEEDDDVARQVEVAVDDRHQRQRLRPDRRHPQRDPERRPARDPRQAPDDVHGPRGQLSRHDFQRRPADQRRPPWATADSNPSLVRPHDPRNRCARAGPRSREPPGREGHRRGRGQL